MMWQRWGRIVTYSALLGVLLVGDFVVWEVSPVLAFSFVLASARGLATSGEWGRIVPRYG